MNTPIKVLYNLCSKLTLLLSHTKRDHRTTFPVYQALWTSEPFQRRNSNVSYTTCAELLHFYSLTIHTDRLYAFIAQPTCINETHTNLQSTERVAVYKLFKSIYPLQKTVYKTRNCIVPCRNAVANLGLTKAVVLKVTSLKVQTHYRVAFICSNFCTLQCLNLLTVFLGQRDVPCVLQNP